MKFEKPVAEIERFEISDIISASGIQPTGEAYDTINEGACIGGAPDNNMTDCL